MSFTVRDIIGRAYLLLDNPTEDELSYPVVLAEYESVIGLMRQEQILGALDDRIRQDSVTFLDTTGVVDNTFVSFGDPIYLEFNGEAINVCPIGMLDLYKQAGTLRIAFWRDLENAVDQISQSIPQIGILKVWYEPDTPDSPVVTSNVDLKDSLKMCIATRLALACVKYVHFKDQTKQANMAVLYQGLAGEAKTWTDIYLDRMNRIGMNRPFTRLPFMAETVI